MQNTSGAIPTPDWLAIRVTEPCIETREAIAQCPTSPMSKTIACEMPHAASNLADEKNNAPPSPFFDENTSCARESTWREPKQHHSPLYKAFQWTVLLLLFICFSAFFALERYFFLPIMIDCLGRYHARRHCHGDDRLD